MATKKVKSKSIKEVKAMNEKEFRDIINSFEDIVYSANSKGNIIFVSSNVSRYGFSSNEVLGKHLSDFIHPDDRKKVLNDFKETIAKGKVITSVFRLLKKNGDYVFAEEIGRPIKDKNGKIIQVAGVIRDVTERTRAERELEGIFNLSPDMLAICTTEGKFLKVNATWEAVLGYKTDEILKLGWSKLVHPDDAKRTNREVKKQLKGRSVANFVNRFKCKNGTYRTLEWQATSADGNMVHATARDVTDRDRAKDRFKVLFESSRDAIMTLEPPTWAFTSGNPSTVKMFGCKNEKDFVTFPPWKLSPPKQPDGQPSGDKAKAMIMKAMERGSNFFEWTHRRNNGEDFPATVLLTRMTVAGKTFLQATVRDVTERNNATEALQKSESRLKSIMNASPDCIKLLDLKGKAIYLSPCGLKEHNLKHKDLKAWSARKTVHKDSLALFDKSFARAKKGETVTFEVKHTAEGANRDWCLLTFSPIRDRQGRIINIFGVSRDITERKKAEKEMVESNKRFNIVQRLAHIGSWHLDIVSDELWWSDEIYRIFGLKPTKYGITYKSFLKAVHPDDRAMVNKAYMKHIKTKHPYHIEHRIVLPNGKIRFVEETCDSEWDKNGKILHSTGAVQDITYRRRVAEDLRKAHTELEKRVEERTAELQKAKDELQDKVRDLEAFSNIAVGRELRMVELKKKIKRLERQLTNKK